MQQIRIDRDKKAALIFLSILIVSVSCFFYRANIFWNDYRMTVGVITSSDWGGKGPGGPSINYVYKLNGKLMKGSIRHPEFTRSTVDEHLVGRTFPIVYRKGLFTDDNILITPKDFQVFKETFPDSLQWVIKYIKKIKMQAIGS